jgi:hypothetical protein
MYFYNIMFFGGYMKTLRKAALSMGLFLIAAGSVPSVTIANTLDRTLRGSFGHVVNKVVESAFIDGHKACVTLALAGLCAHKTNHKTISSICCGLSIASLAAYLATRAIVGKLHAVNSAYTTGQSQWSSQA